MKIILICICVSCICVSLLAETNTYYLSADVIMQGLRSHSEVNSIAELKARQRWMSDLWVKRMMLTNQVERIKLAEELVRILNSETSNYEDKGAAAYLIGLFQLTNGIGDLIRALISNFIVGSKAALEPDLMPIEGERPAQHALIQIGEPAIPEIIALIESTSDAFTLECGARVFLGIKGQEDGAEFLKQIIDSQTDKKKIENLKAALSSKYFTDPDYRFSGPEEKVKRMLAQQILPAQVRLKPEVLEISPGILTAFVRLPEGYPVKNITSATCDGALYEKMMLNDDHTAMIIKFRRQDIEKALAQIRLTLDTQFVVRGVWRSTTGTNFFEGTASIKKIAGEKSK